MRAQSASAMGSGMSRWFELAKRLHMDDEPLRCSAEGVQDTLQREESKDCCA